MVRVNWLNICASVVATGCLLWLSAANVVAQPAIFSFETDEDLAPWLSTSTATLARSSFGATDGTSALLIDNLTGGFKNNIATVPNNVGPSHPQLADFFAAFDLAAQEIAGGGTPKLEFDLAWDFSAGSIPPTGGYIQLGLFVNSSSAGGGGFKGYGTSAFINSNAGFSQWPSLGTAALNDGVTLTPTGPSSTHVAIPFGAGKTLTLSNASTFFDVGLQSNGVWDGSVDFAIDNIKFTGVPVFEEHTLFSWETPDDPGTPGVNEQLEGWTLNPGASAPTPISITSEGATDGASALQIDRTSLVSGFTWGNLFGLDATADPGSRGQIDDLVTRINGATQIALDITYEDHPNSPTYTNLWLAIADDSGEYYQGFFPGFDITNADNGPITQTLVINIDDLIDTSSNKNLAVEGLVEGTNQLGIFLGSGTDGGAVYQIDNFRLISEVPATTPGDFDNDGDVDGRDFLAWQRGQSPNPNSASDLAEWQANYSGGALSAVTAAVPEPATFSLLTVLGLALLGRGKRA